MNAKRKLSCIFVCVCMCDLRMRIYDLTRKWVWSVFSLQGDFYKFNIKTFERAIIMISNITLKIKIPV